MAKHDQHRAYSKSRAGFHRRTTRRATIARKAAFLANGGF
jgi:hypothetical protein